MFALWMRNGLVDYHVFGGDGKAHGRNPDLKLTGSTRSNISIKTSAMHSISNMSPSRWLSAVHCIQQVGRKRKVDGFAGPQAPSPSPQIKTLCSRGDFFTPLFAVSASICLVYISPRHLFAVIMLATDKSSLRTAGTGYLSKPTVFECSGWGCFVISLDELLFQFLLLSSYRLSRHLLALSCSNCCSIVVISHIFTPCSMLDFSTFLSAAWAILLPFCLAFVDASNPSRLTR